uniref:Putative secreted protein n=1 Tax=Amblyomma triste TaxID=251400 RepID=A0A023G2Q3_AMBTT
MQSLSFVVHIFKIINALAICICMFRLWLMSKHSSKKKTLQLLYSISQTLHILHVILEVNLHLHSAV